jgi:hypothetical protein
MNRDGERKRNGYIYTCAWINVYGGNIERRNDSNKRERHRFLYNKKKQMRTRVLIVCWVRKEKKSLSEHTIEIRELTQK